MVYNNRTLTADTSGPVAPGSEEPVGPDGLPKWANPFAWDWGHILSDAWNALWSKCIGGAAPDVGKLAIGTFATNLIAKGLLQRGAAIFVGPEGYAALAIGDCLFTLYKS